MHENTSNGPSYTEKILSSMAEHKASAALVLADYRNEKKLLENGIINENEFYLYEQELLKNVDSLRADPNVDDDSDIASKSFLFLSYNHADVEMMLRVTDKLKEFQIEVRTDLSHVESGDDIEEFILSQIRENSAVMLLVSKNSLMSVWVSYESTLVIFNQLLNQKKILLVGLDKEYENNDFFENAIVEFDKKIQMVNESISRCHRNGVEPVLYEDQRRKLAAARKHLPDILQKLRKSRVTPLNEFNFDATMKQIAGQLLKAN